MSSTAIIGAGMSGLVAALRLAQAGEEVTVFERDSVPGGLAAGFTPMPGGASLERYYHHIFRSDTRVIALCTELGLDSRLVWSRPATMCYYGGRLASLDSASALLRFGLLPPADRLRLAAALGTLKLAPRCEPFEGRLALGWLRSVAGLRATKLVFEPLFRAKFGEYAETISLGWFWARIHDRTPMLGYLHGGFAALYESLVAEVRKLGGTVNFGTAVSGIERGESGLTVTHQTGALRSSVAFDRVISTLAAKRLQALCPQAGVGPAAQAPLLGARCLILALDRPLTGRYWINVCEPDWPFVVLVEHTAMMPPEDYDGAHLLYIGNYGPSFPSISAEALAAEFEPYLRMLNPGYSNRWLRGAWQFVASEAQPVVAPGYRATIPPHRTAVSGLYMANLSQVYPHDRGQNYAVELAERLVESLERAAPASAAPTR